MHNRWVSIDRDTFIIWFEQCRSCNHGLGIHVDLPWSEDVKLYDAPQRIYLHLIWWSVAIGLGDGKSQVWHHRDGNLYRWRRVTWHPNRSIQCRQKYFAEKPYCGEGEWECSRLRHHRGAHA